jgi:hypothetical protein
VDETVEAGPGAPLCPPPDRALLAGRRATLAPRPDRAAAPPRPRRAPRPARRLAAVLAGAAFPAAAYVASRGVVLVLASILAARGHRSLLGELLVFDGAWYVRLAEHGYPHAVPDGHSTLGFLPLYPLAARALGDLASLGTPIGALAVSGVGGLVATVLAHRLAASWWGERAARRAVLLFVLFPGSVVFSLAYSEGLALPLVLGCLLALRSRRWLLAGALAGAATAVEPVAAVIVPVCAVVALRHLRSEGWRNPRARRCLLAPLLAPTGLAAVGAFEWAWVGTPFATVIAQHEGWHQQASPLGLLDLPLVRHLLATPVDALAYLSTWNLWNAVAGGAFLAASLVALWRVRGELSSGALGWAAGVAVLCAWSVLTPPNARMVLVAAPAVLVWARRLPPARLGLFLGVEAIAFVAMSGLTLSGRMLP